MTKTATPYQPTDADAMRVEILLRQLAAQCPDPRRCKRMRCRRSGRCDEIAKVKRDFAHVLGRRGRVGRAAPRAELERL